MSESNGNLHQLLAVKKDAASRANQISDETSKIFAARHLFYGSLKSYEPFEETQNPDLVHEEPEQEYLSYTVGEKMGWFAKEFSRLIDIEFQIDRTNMEAKADVKVDGLELKEVPATFLLDLIGFCERVKKVYQHIQVLDPKSEWALSEEMGDGVYRATKDEVTYRTKKVHKHKILHEATEQHPRPDQGMDRGRACRQVHEETLVRYPDRAAEVDAPQKARRPDRGVA